MCALEFATAFKDEEFADVDLLLLCREQQAGQDAVPLTAPAGNTDTSLTDSYVCE